MTPALAAPAPAMPAPAAPLPAARASAAGSRSRRALSAVAVLAGTLGLGCLAQAGWIHAKAHLAQRLIDRAWARAEQGERDARPWPWADTRPVARLALSAHGAPLVVLEGSSGRNLAFGPTHDPASVPPGERGNSVIAGHRDTHFAALRTLAPGARLKVERPGGASVWFTVTDVRVVDSRRQRIALDADEPRLTLVTCWPFEALDAGGPLRLVVTAVASDGGGSAPERGTSAGPARRARAAAPSRA